MRQYELKNDFHNSRAIVRAEGLMHIHNEIEIKLSKRQARVAWKKLCGITECMCSGTTGARGYQFFEKDGRKIQLIIIAGEF